MSVIRAMVVLAASSGIPADNVTNVFHFNGGAEPIESTQLDSVAARLIAFYTELVGGNTTALMADYAASIADTGHEIRLYTYDDEDGQRLAFQGAPPELVEPMSFSGRGVEALGFPQEVALKLTFRDTVSVQWPLAQRTGGVYLGPFEIGTGGGTTRSVPSTPLITRIVNAGSSLLDSLSEELVIWSRPYAGRAEIIREGRPNLPALPARPGQTFVANQVFVDDEWDTIRKRGRKAGTRTIFNVPG